MVRNHINRSRSAANSRRQVQFKRRRECRTDYRHRLKLIKQSLNGRGRIKYRLVVRILKTQIICQIISAHLEGDRTLCEARSAELPRYGVRVGLTNYCAAYLTGLLVARRFLKALGKDNIEGQVEPDGTLTETRDNVDFTCVPDMQLYRATRGARIFAAFKGSNDGGLYVPLGAKRLAGYDKETKKLDTEALRGRIFGDHVADYMRELKEEDEEKYQQEFQQHIQFGIEPDDIEEMYEAAMKNIRANPEKYPSKPYVPKKNPYKPARDPNSIHRKLTKQEKREKLEAKKRLLEEKYDAQPVRPMDEMEVDKEEEEDEE